jgi:hypothetical protein
LSRWQSFQNWSTMLIKIPAPSSFSYRKWQADLKMYMEN